MELELLRKVAEAARRLREPVGYESGATSHDLDDALQALDDFRRLPIEPAPKCTGYLAHSAFAPPCPVCDR